MLGRIRYGGRILTLGAAVAIAAAACSSSGGTSAAPASAAASSAPASAEASAAASAEASAAAESYEITVKTDAKLGKFLVGEDGKTLYKFTPDSKDKSACTDACAQAWPPLTIEGSETAKAGTDVTGTVATFKRDDGTTQVSYNGVPLYYFGKDKAAGDVNGQGLNGKWFVVAP